MRNAGATARSVQWQRVRQDVGNPHPIAAGEPHLSTW